MGREEHNCSECEERPRCELIHYILVVQSLRKLSIPPTEVLVTTLEQIARDIRSLVLESKGVVTMDEVDRLLKDAQQG